MVTDKNIIFCANRDSACSVIWGVLPVLAGLLMSIVAGGYDRSPGVAPVGRAFIRPVGSFTLLGQGFAVR